jgi:hypothetical protein
LSPKSTVLGELASVATCLIWSKDHSLRESSPAVSSQRNPGGNGAGVYGSPFSSVNLALRHAMAQEMTPDQPKHAPFQLPDPICKASRTLRRERRLHTKMGLTTGISTKPGKGLAEPSGPHNITVTNLQKKTYNISPKQRHRSRQALARVIAMNFRKQFIQLHLCHNTSQSTATYRRLRLFTRQAESA